MPQRRRLVRFAQRGGFQGTANVLLDADGAPYVTDFGLARKIEGDSSLTPSGSILGTPNYMAPEQAGGRNREITTTSDVYSLGAILYEVLTGRPPFHEPIPLDTVMAVIHRDPERPRSIDVAVAPTSRPSASSASRRIPLGVVPRPSRWPRTSSAG